MKLTKIALALLVGVGAGCAGTPPSPSMASADLPSCFESNYDRERDLFTVRGEVGDPVNQQCLLVVGAHGDRSAPMPYPSGRDYRVYLSDGGGGGGGGSIQALRSAGSGIGGGGGGGGAGARESEATVNLAAGVYKLTLGTGGAGGAACKPTAGMGGGPGWLGSPSSMVRVSTGDLVIGTHAADTHKRVTRGQNERNAGARDGHGGRGEGGTLGGQGAVPGTGGVAHAQASAGAGKGESGMNEPGGAAGRVSAGEKSPGSGGGGGATSAGAGGAGGGESLRQPQSPPQRGTLGSGGGGGEGSLTECEPGARGGHGYIALRLI